MTRVGVGTIVEKGKEKKIIDGEEYILEKPLKADRELIAALQQAKQALASDEDEEDEIPF